VLVEHATVQAQEPFTLTYNTMTLDAETQRLKEDEERQKNWKRWGPYLADRQWGTVREDYSPDGSCWSYFPHDHARSRAYRWGEDGLLGITDRQCRLCFALSLWNGKDSILKERLFGLTGPEGNHGEDVKELYFYLESLPSHAYMKALYKYPHAAFPYTKLVEENKRRGRHEPEFELVDTGIFQNNAYFDVYVEYAKASPDDILIRIRAVNRGATAAPLHILPTLWFRNTWAWGRSGEGYTKKAHLWLAETGRIQTQHESLPDFELSIDSSQHSHTPLFTENETNIRRLFLSNTAQAYVKDAFHDYLIYHKHEAVNPALSGTKAAFCSQFLLNPGQSTELRLRLYPREERPKQLFGSAFDQCFEERQRETEQFYAERCPPQLNSTEADVMRQAYAGLLWSKQFYYYSVQEWAEGDPAQPAPAKSRERVRNVDWKHLYNRDIISMPDKWEYPWYAAWDLAFHMIPFARIDPDFAKQQLLLLLREWYMHPNGQIPAYEFAFSDVNPPVHAWACWRVYKMTAPKGKRDRTFLARAFHKLLLNFTWWVNRKDIDGKNLFSGGFLGLDNIGVFDRSQPLPVGGHLEQADATAWMAFYCLTMLSIALELASEDQAYDDVASKFFEHFVSITDAINTLGGTGLWDEQDGFYYDQLHLDGKSVPLRTRSIVGIIPLLAVEVLDEEQVEKLPGFKKRMSWFLKERKDLAKHITYMEHTGPQAHGRNLLAVPSKQRLERVLRYVFEQNEFLSPYGLRSLSKVHDAQPYIFRMGHDEYRVDYTPGESTTSLFGGNSNWRGPVWFPVNYLLIEALERYHHFYQDSLLIDCPSGSGNKINLKQASQEIARRLCGLFTPDQNGVRPSQHELESLPKHADCHTLNLFYEYFNAETGRGCGASHQTGWTALITRCLERMAEGRSRSRVTD
jgi:hypothetical protein